MSQKLCFSWDITIICHLSRTSIFWVLYTTISEKDFLKILKNFFPAKKTYGQQSLKFFTSSLLQELPVLNFSKQTKTFRGSPVHTKFKERERLALPSFLSPSCSGQRIKDVQELGVWNHMELGLNHNSPFTGQLGSGLTSPGFSCFTCRM